MTSDPTANPAMTLSAADRRRFDEDGFVLLPGAIQSETLDRARAVLDHEFPAPDRADLDEHPELQGPFAGVRPFPWAHLDLNLLTVMPELTALAEQLLGSSDIMLYKAELWAKYAGWGPYDQPHHRDYGNHTLVVPRADGRWRQVTTFVYLSDVDDGCGPTALVRRADAKHIPLGYRRLDHGAFADCEVRVPGPAGSVLLYSTDIFHRATELTGDGSSRFATLLDFKHTDMFWGGKHAWAHFGNQEAMSEFVQALDTRQRSLFGFPPPGHEYWNEQTLTDTQLRYPRMDLRPYGATDEPPGETPPVPDN